MVDDRRGLWVLPATDTLKDRFLIVDKFAEPRTCAHGGRIQRGENLEQKD